MKALLLLATLCLIPLARADYVELPSHEVYSDYQPAKPGRPTFVLVNGLVYDLGRWNELAGDLAGSGYGVLRYYFRGQLLSLRRELEQGKPSFFLTGLKPEDFSTELAGVMNALKIEKAVVVGLSFGASIAAEFAERHPTRTEQLVLMAPLVVPLDRYDPQGAWIRQNLDALRLLWGPLWGPYVYDMYYNWIFRTYLGDRLSPERIPAEMHDVAEEYKEAIFHQVRAMRDFDLRTYRFRGLQGRVHMMLASEEEGRALTDQFLAYNSFGSSQASLVYLSPSWHAIPDSSGAYAAALLERIASGDFAGVYYAPTDRSLSEIYPHASATELQERVKQERGED